MYVLFPAQENSSSEMWMMGTLIVLEGQFGVIEYLLSELLRVTNLVDGLKV